MKCCIEGDCINESSLIETWNVYEIDNNKLKVFKCCQCGKQYVKTGCFIWHRVRVAESKNKIS